MTTCSRSTSGPGLNGARSGRWTSGADRERSITRAREGGFDDFLGAETYYGDAAIDAQTMSSIAADTADRIMRVADDGKLPFPDQHFDFVCTNQVFEHVHNLGPVLDELARVTNPDGVHVSRAAHARSHHRRPPEGAAISPAACPLA